MFCLHVLPLYYVCSTLKGQKKPLNTLLAVHSLLKRCCFARLPLQFHMEWSSNADLFCPARSCLWLGRPEVILLPSSTLLCDPGSRPADTAAFSVPVIWCWWDSLSVVKLTSWHWHNFILSVCPVVCGGWPAEVSVQTLTVLSTQKQLLLLYS